jgi:hypothetical protein
MRDIEAIINSFERQLGRKLSGEERRLLRLAYEAYPPCDEEKEADGLAQAGD